jgi:hypothetical protein
MGRCCERSFMQSLRGRILLSYYAHVEKIFTNKGGNTRGKCAIIEQNLHLERNFCLEAFFV